MPDLFARLKSRLIKPITTACCGAALLAFSAVAPAAQQLTVGQGHAAKVNLVEEARTLSMRDTHARALYAYIRANPSVMENAQFYVNFLIYLMHKSEGFDCRQAFASEFERRDFFTNSFALKDQIRQMVNSVTIPQRFDIAYTIDTGRFDFSTSTLPFKHASVGLREYLSHSISAAGGASSCAHNILNGTQVSVQQFPWTFKVVDENAQQARQFFPFGTSMQLSSNDARVLFDRFGRRL